MKMDIDELIKFEKRGKLWDILFFDYPIWIHCREHIVNNVLPADRKISFPTITELFNSTIFSIKFLFNQNRYDKVFFLMQRSELLEIYNNDNSDKKILFLNHEQERVYNGDYISSDFFNIFRLLCRKSAYMIFWIEYKKIIKKLKSINVDPNLYKYIKIAMGDAIFLSILSKILDNKSKKFYTGSVIPIGEKFINTLNSYEVQHGIIHPSHIGYIGIPKVKNRLILYSKRYKKILEDCKYDGELIIDTYKDNMFLKKSSRSFFIVIYTQPTIEMQIAIDDFFNRYKPVNVYIQKHPKDYYNYNIASGYFVTNTIPTEVKHPIFYISSVIENFTQYDRSCYICNFKVLGVELDNILNIYKMDSNSLIIVKNSLYELYNYIKKEST